jgi:hypothetical protein
MDLTFNPVDLNFNTEDLKLIQGFNFSTTAT